VSDTLTAHTSPVRDSVLRTVVALRHRFLVQVVLAYLALRLFTAIVLVIAARHQQPVAWTGPHPDYFSMTVLWDGTWYRRIAEHGYPAVLPTDASGALQQNEWAFYPLFPMMASALMKVTGLGFPVVGSSLALVLGTVGAGVMGVLLRERLGAKVAFAAVCVYAASPPSPSLQVAYTESLAILLLCAFLLALSRERWLVASVLALCTGLARPIALPLGLVALVAVVLRWRRREREPVSRRDYGSMLTALLSCGVAGLMWPAIVWWGTGSPSAYTDTMGTWRSSGKVTPFAPWLGMGQYLFGSTVAPIGLALIAIAFVVVVCGPWARGLGPLLRTWCLGYVLYLGAVLDPWTSVYRYLLELFPLAAVMVGGAWLNDRDQASRHVMLRTVILVLLGLAWQVWWVRELWMFVPPVDNPP
jgi:hypothetical protein